MSTALTRSAWALACGLGFSTFVHHAIADDAVDRCVDSAEKGQAMRRAGKLVEARASLLRCAAEECPAFVRGDCARWAAETQSATPSIVVRASAGARDVVDVRLLIDGAAVSEKLDGQPRLINPGEHQIRGQARNGEWTAPVRALIAAGEHERVITIKFKDPTPPRESLKKSPSTLSWILGGIGLTGLAAGGVAYGIGVSERSALLDSCAVPRVCSIESIDTARSKLVIGDVFMGVGALTLASALILYLVAPNTEVRTETRSVNAALRWPTPIDVPR